MPNLVSKSLESDDSLVQASEPSSVVVPVIEEQLEIYKELRATGVVRVRKIVHQEETPIAETLDSETVEIERIPKNEAIDTPPSVRMEGEVMIIPVIEEVLVTTKQLRLVEEVRITRRRSSTVHRENVTLRSEQVIVERETASDATSEA